MSNPTVNIIGMVAGVVSAIVALQSYFSATQDDRGRHEGQTATNPASVKTSYIQVPDVVGLSQTKATTSLHSQAFEVRLGKAFSRQPVGIVIEQVPTANAKVPRGALVSLVVSKGGPVAERAPEKALPVTSSRANKEKDHRLANKAVVILADEEAGAFRDDVHNMLGTLGYQLLPINGKNRADITFTLSAKTHRGLQGWQDRSLIQLTIRMSGARKELIEVRAEAVAHGYAKAHADAVSTLKRKLSLADTFAVAALD